MIRGAVVTAKFHAEQKHFFFFSQFPIDAVSLKAIKDE